MNISNVNGSAFTPFHVTPTEYDRPQVDYDNAAKSSSISLSQEQCEQPMYPAFKKATFSPRTKALSDEPSLKEVVEAISRAKKAKGNPTEALAHLLEHFNKGWLFKLYEKTKNRELLIILCQKIEIRDEFERSLKELSWKSTAPKTPSCFICFAPEHDVSSWIKEFFVPDMELADVNPIFHVEELSRSNERNAFQAMLRSSERVIVISTPQLVDLYSDLQENPTQVNKEIQIALEPDRDKQNPFSETSLWTKEHQKVEDLPPLFFDPSLKTFLVNRDEITQSYYAKALELFATIRGIEDSEASKVKESFFKTVETILKKQDFTLHKLKQFSEDRDSETELRVKAISNGIAKKIKKLTLPPYPPRFTGRNEELQQLKCLYENGTRHVAIIGPSGVGKSALAVAFAHRSILLFKFIYTLQVSETAPLKSGLLKLADDLNLGGTEEQRLNGLKNWLNEIDSKYLIVLDNIDDVDLFDELQEFIKPSHDVCFLLTTVMSEQPRQLGFTHLKLNPFQPKESEDLLHAAQSLKNDDFERRMVDESPFRYQTSTETTELTSIAFREWYRIKLLKALKPSPSGLVSQETLIKDIHSLFDAAVFASAAVSYYLWQYQNAPFSREKLLQRAVINGSGSLGNPLVGKMLSGNTIYNIGKLITEMPGVAVVKSNSDHEESGAMIIDWFSELILDSFGDGKETSIYPEFYCTTSGKLIDLNLKWKFFESKRASTATGKIKGLEGFLIDQDRMIRYSLKLALEIFIRTMEKSTPRTRNERMTDKTKIEKPLTVAMSLLRDYQLIPTGIEAHHFDDNDDEQLRRISNARVNYIVGTNDTYSALLFIFFGILLYKFVEKNRGTVSTIPKESARIASYVATAIWLGYTEGPKIIPEIASLKMAKTKMDDKEKML